MAAKGRSRKASLGNEPNLFPFEEDAEDGAAVSSSPIERWEIPGSWAWATVNDIGEVRLGMGRSPSNRPGANAAKYLRAANITSEGLDLTNLLEMEFDEEAREVYALRPGDILLSEASGSPEQVGKTALWLGEIPLCCFQNTVIRVRPMGVSDKYALIVFDHYFKNGLFASLVRGVGIGHLGLDRFSKLPFPLPPKQEQDRIAAEFAVQADRASKALASLRSAEEKMQLQRRSIVIRELGVGEGVVKLPTGWSKVKIGEICEVVNGRVFKSSEWREDGLPIIRIQNLHGKDMPFNYFDGGVEDKHLVDDGDLLFAWSGDSGTSFGAYIWQGERGALNQHIFKMTPNESRVNRDFLFYSINAQLDSYAAAAKGGGKRLHLTRSQFVDSEIALPPLGEQGKIVDAIKEHEKTLSEQAAIIGQNISRTESLIRSMLRCAVEGKLVEQNKNEGNASLLVTEYKLNLDKYLKDLAKRRRGVKGSAVGKRKTNATQPKKNLVEVLKEEGPLLPRELLRKSGYREENSDDVEEFYRQLHIAHQSKKIIQDTKTTREKAKLKAVV